MALNKKLQQEGLELPDPLEVQGAAKLKRCDNFKWSENVPRCYSENTSKEELVLEHVLEYKRQFQVMYDPTRKLLLAPKNEKSIRKFICTTIRPTKLPFTELYEWEKCSKFIADYLEYEELSDPTKFPAVIPSPANVLNDQAGDCFDFSIVLCSLLIGAGYDAFVVIGTAPKRITTRDESLMDCPFDLDLPANEEHDDPYLDEDSKHMEPQKTGGVQPIDDFDVEQKKPEESKFDREQKEREEKQKEEQRIRDEVIDDDEPDYEKDDQYGGNRKHCWVFLQKGKRLLADSFFIEPSTGRKYNLDESPYYSIEAIFNNKNYWINMDTSTPIAELNFEFENDNTGEWEYVMINTDEKKADDDEDGAGSEASDPENEGANNDEEILDMPPPWSPKLIVNKEKFAELCPKGEKTVFFKKCKVEFYSDCKQVDGLVKRVTIYEDFKKLITKEVRSYYKFRRDKLILRRRFPYEFKTIEHYESSMTQSYWKKMITIDDVYRKIFFYHHRKDGLIYREERIGDKTFEYFKGREDKLVYRSVKYDPLIPVLEEKHMYIEDKHYEKKYYVKKMAQKFELDPNRPAEEQIRKTEFNIETNEVLIYYHYKEGQIFRKPDRISRQDLLNSGKMGESNDKDVKEDQETSKKQQFYQQINDMEQKCHTQIKANEEMSLTERHMRRDNEKQIQQLRANWQAEEVFSKILEKSIYEKAREKMQEGKAKVVDEAQEQTENDELLPILKKLSLEGKDKLDEEAAIQVKNEALSNLKQRLLTRAEIIQRRLQHEQGELEKAFNQLKRKGENLTAEDEKRFDEEISKANFKIDILTERASQHYRTSLRKFEKMDDMLMKHPLLKALQKNKL